MLFFFLLALSVESSRLLSSCITPFSLRAFPFQACPIRQPLFFAFPRHYSVKPCPTNLEYGKYKVQGFLGHGCFGTVFLGQYESEQVAIKVTKDHPQSKVSLQHELNIYQVS